MIDGWLAALLVAVPVQGFCSRKTAHSQPARCLFHAHSLRMGETFWTSQHDPLGLSFAIDCKGPTNNFISNACTFSYCCHNNCDNSGMSRILHSCAQVAQEHHSDEEFKRRPFFHLLSVHAFVPLKYEGRTGPFYLFLGPTGTIIICRPNDTLLARNNTHDGWNGRYPAPWYEFCLRSSSLLVVILEPCLISNRKSFGGSSGGRTSFCWYRCYYCINTDEE